MELLRACEAWGLALSEPDTSAIVARLDASLEKAKLRYDFEFHLPLLEDVRRVGARHLVGHHTGASAAGIIECGARAAFACAACPTHS
jgi:hypothetical protein